MSFDRKMQDLRAVFLRIQELKFHPDVKPDRKAEIVDVLRYVASSPLLVPTSSIFPFISINVSIGEVVIFLKHKDVAPSLSLLVHLLIHGLLNCCIVFCLH
jgi:hypothetical protein